MEVALRRTYEATPDPKLVVAVGDCGCTGGIFGESYASCGRVANVIPVDVAVPGCPPPPLRILQGILTAISARPGACRAQPARTTQSSIAAAPASAEGGGRGGDGAAGGDDVVDQRHAQPRERPRGREGAAYVRRALARSQRALLARRPQPAQRVAIERQAEFARGEGRELGGLVVAARAQPQRMERHRDDERGERQRAARALAGQQRAEHARMAALAVELERAHQRVHGEVEAPWAADQRVVASRAADHLRRPRAAPRGTPAHRSSGPGRPGRPQSTQMRRRQQRAQRREQRRVHVDFL